MINRFKDMAYGISADIEEAMMCLQDIRDAWHRGDEIRESLIDVANDDLKSAYKSALKIEAMMQQIIKFEEQSKEILDENNN